MGSQTFLPAGTPGLHTAEAAAISKTSYKATASLNVREGASSAKKVITTLKKGTIVTATEQKGDWLKISFPYTSGKKTITKTGWASSSYLKENHTYEAITKKYLFTKKKTSIYLTPKAGSSADASVSTNTGFYSTQKVKNSIGETWYRVYLDGKRYYLRSGGLSAKTFTAFSTKKYKADKQTPLYKYYGLSHPSLASIPKGTVLSSKKKIGNWYRVSYKGQAGYIYGKDFTENNKTVTTDINANYFTTKKTELYSEPEAEGSPVYTIAAGNGFLSRLKAVNPAGETWYKIQYNNRDLYVRAADVKKYSFFPIAAAEYEAKANTFLYASFGNAFEILEGIKKGTIIEVKKKIGFWFEVTYNKKTGYIHRDDFKKYEVKLPAEESIAAAAFLTKAAVGLYKTAAPGAALTATLPKTTLVTATHKTENGFYKVTAADGRTGYLAVSSLDKAVTGYVASQDSYQFIDLRTASKVTASQINNYIAAGAGTKASVLKGKGQAFIDAGRKYGVNALYLAAHAIHESGYGTSDISLGKNNLFGFGSYDITAYLASYRFKSVDECIEYIAREIKATYLKPSNWKYNGAFLGYRTNSLVNGSRADQYSTGMNFYYASDVLWGSKIAAHMQKMRAYDKKEYTGLTANEAYPGQPAKPAGSDVFPAAIKTVTNASLALYDKKGGSKVSDVPKGKTIYLREKTNDYWVRLKYGSKEYWTNSINFVNYNKYVTVYNLGRVSKADSLNVRASATTASTIVGTLKRNTYVRFMIDSKNEVTMDSTKNWYKIKLDDGSLGWVSKSYILQELNKKP